MGVTPDKIIKQLIEYIKSLTKRKRIILFSSIGGAIAVIAIIAIIINSYGYVVLYSGLSADEAGEIVAQLNEMGVESRLEADGTILVPRDQESQLKMQLSTQGYPQSTLNYDVFTNNSDYMTTDFEKRQYLLFQLQNRLQDAIKTLDSVKNAIVTISLPDEDSYVLAEDEVPATASVVLDLAANNELSNSQIKGIQELVAKSVSGLETSNVAIVDSMGNILSSGSADETASVASTRLELEGNISKTLENKIAQLFAPVYGANATRVVVSATVDVRKSVSEEKTYTPVVDDNGVISQQDLSRNVSGGGTTAGGTAGTESNTGVSVYAQGDTGNEDGVISSSSSTDYLVNSLTEQIERDGYALQAVSAAVLINDTTLTQEQLASYKEMVSKASGIDEENITIAGAQFLGDEGVDTAPGTGGILASGAFLPLLIAVGSGLLLLLLGLFLVLRRRKKRKKKLTQEEALVLEQEVHEDGPKEIVINESREQALRRQIQELSASNPDIVAQLLRTWIKEDEDGYE